MMERVRQCDVLDGRVSVCNIFPCEGNAGLVELPICDSVTIDFFGDSLKTSVYDRFISYVGCGSSPSNGMIVKAFTQSLALYSVIRYLLMIDEHVGLLKYYSICISLE